MPLFSTVSSGVFCNDGLPDPGNFIQAGGMPQMHILNKNRFQTVTHQFSTAFDHKFTLIIKKFFDPVLLGRIQIFQPEIANRTPGHTVAENKQQRVGGVIPLHLKDKILII